MGLWTYDDTSRRESLLSILRDLSPTADNYLVTNLGIGGPAMNTYHEWTVRRITRPTATNFAVEGQEFTEPAGDAPTRSGNITAPINRFVKVSGTEEAVDRATKGSAMDDEKKVKLMRLKADMEFAILNGAAASGASGTARGMNGINTVISTNLTARASGTSMSTTELEDIHQNSWDAVGSEFVADVLLCPMGIKRKIATLTTRVQNQANSTDRIYANVEVYETSSGLIKVVPHKDVINATGSTHVYAIREDLFRIAFLKGREPKYKPLAATGDHEKGLYNTELTLESLGQAASVKRYGYALNG
ncbi:MAG: DUF5309 family protein [Candidatus Riesia sp.]|nr:DUF5309 family protein [Candidatus Riesia sp.]